MKMLGSKYNVAEHHHEHLCLQLFKTPREQRPLTRSAPWRVREAGATIFLPGDESCHENRGTPSRNQFLFIESARVEEIIGRPLTANMFWAFRGRSLQSLFVTNIINNLGHDLACGSPAGALVGDNLIVALVTWLAGTSQEVPLDAECRVGLSSRELSRLQEFIDVNLEYSISLDTLAGLVGVSLRHFRRALNVTTGLSPHELVLSRRLERAKQMIDQGQLSFTEIAVAVGFADHSHMNKIFRRSLGMTPSAYRNRN
jgi:AraC-like DNA-binding protein